MHCVAPPPLTDDELSAVIDGEADTGTLDHLAQCQWCTDRLAQAQSIEMTLRAGLRSWKCPPSQQLGDFTLGMLSPEERWSIAAHVDACPRCVEELAELQAFLGREAAPALPPAARPRTRLGELVAHLLPRTPAMALRGVAPRQIAAEAEGTTILIDVQPGSGGGAIVRGQVIDDAQDRWTGALVEVRQAGILQITTTVDDLGTFDCGPLPATPIELRLTPPDGRAIVVPEIPLDG
jgi:anti-sigma factor RsiW